MIKLDKKIKDFKYKKGMKVSELVESFTSLGYQSINLAKAADIITRMKKDKAKIFLTFTSNMTSSGLRGLFAQLIKLKFVDVVITTVGSIEEDLIKSKKDFYVGSFEADDLELGKEGINRIGNIYVKNEAYSSFEEIINPVLEQIYLKKKYWTVSEFIKELGNYVNDANSIVYQANKNNIPIYCPAITDGALGFHLVFFKQKHPDFVLDEIKDLENVMNEAAFAEKTGVIILGGGVSKHHAIFTNLMRDGMEYAVYITTAHSYAGSLSGATTQEARSWGKLKSDADAVTVNGDVTILFPLVITKVLEDLGYD